LSAVEIDVAVSDAGTRITRPLAMLSIGYDIGPIGSVEFSAGMINGSNSLQRFSPSGQRLFGRDVRIKTNPRTIFSLKDRLSLRLTEAFYLTGAIGIIGISGGKVTATATKTTTTNGLALAQSLADMTNSTTYKVLFGGGFEIRALNSMKIRADVFAYKNFFNSYDYYGTAGLTYQF